MKPRIIVFSEDNEQTFRFMSDGWHDAKKAHTARAKATMTRATKAIEAGKDVPDTVKRLLEAGFAVRRPDYVKEPWLKDANERSKRGEFPEGVL